MGKNKEEKDKTAKLTRSEKHDRLLNIIQTLRNKEFTGYIKVNFSQGGIGRVERFEEIQLNTDNQSE